MSTESALWFLGQSAGVVLAVLAGVRLGRARAAAWRMMAVVAVVAMLLWPLMRIFPALAMGLVGARFAAFTEITGVVMPAGLLFSIATSQVRSRERRALWVLLAACGLYFVWSGRWMVRPPLPELSTTKYVDGVCRQSTDYTCVAASLVTMLNAYGVPATETEMARLAYTEPGLGTTDIRAVYALQRKLAGWGLEARYAQLSYEELRRVELPCMVPLEWGYFSSHMVPVLQVDGEGVVLGDPATGPRRLERAEFCREWLGRAICLRRSQRTASR